MTSAGTTKKDSTTSLKKSRIKKAETAKKLRKRGIDEITIVMYSILLTKINNV